MPNLLFGNLRRVTRTKWSFFEIQNLRNLSFYIWVWYLKVWVLRFNSLNFIYLLILLVSADAVSGNLRRVTKIKQNFLWVFRIWEKFRFLSWVLTIYIQLPSKSPCICRIIIRKFTRVVNLDEISFRNWVEKFWVEI